MLHWSDWDENIFESPQRPFLTEIICTSGSLSSSFPPAISLILAWQSPRHRNVAANTMKSLSMWLFSKVIRHVRPGKLALPTCQERSVDDCVLKSSLQLHTAWKSRGNIPGIYGGRLLPSTAVWWERNMCFWIASNKGKKIESWQVRGETFFLLSKKIPVERNFCSQ